MGKGKSILKGILKVIEDGDIVKGPPKSPYEWIKDIVVDDEPTFKEKWELIRKDSKVEGGKRGYNKAAIEYSDRFESLEREYEETLEFIENQKYAYTNQAESLLDKCEELERRRDQLRSELNRLSKENNSNGVSINDLLGGSVNNAFSGGMITDIAYAIKKKKISKEEEKAYNEAKEVFERKLRDLQDKLVRLKDDFDAQEKKYIENIRKIMLEISKLEISIADLEFALG